MWLSHLHRRKSCHRSLFYNTFTKPVAEFVSSLQRCCKTRNLEYGKRIHQEIKEHQLEKDAMLSCNLVNMYRKCSDIRLAREVFDSMSCKDVFTWNSLILGYVENGNAFVALELFRCMDCAPNDVTYVAVLKACAVVARECSKRQQTLEAVMDIHKRVRESGLALNIVISNSLINVYSKCGSIHLAREVFQRMPVKDVFTWTSLIVGSVENGDTLEPLKLFTAMDCKPSRVTLLAMVRACTSLASDRFSQKEMVMEKAVEIHKRLKELKFDSDTVVACMLVNMYSKLRNLTFAKDIFDRMKHKDVVTWNCLIQGYIENWESSKALDLFNTMDCEPSHNTLVLALKACTSLVGESRAGREMLLRKVVAIHADIESRDYDANPSVASALINMYRKLGEMNRARETFERLIVKDVVTWNCIILGYVENGECEAALELFSRISCEPDHLTFVAAAKACGGLATQEDEKKPTAVEKGLSVHKLVTKQGFGSSISVASALINMYGKFRLMHLARDVFESIRFKDVVLWNCLLQGYIENKESLIAIELFERMNCEPNHLTFVNVLKACVNVAGKDVDIGIILEKAVALHEKIKELGFGADVHVSNSLMRLYSQCKSMALARKVFDQTKWKDVVLWNSLVLGYVENDQSLLALDVFSTMDCDPNRATFVAAIKACIQLANNEEFSQRQLALHIGTHIHEQVKKYGYESNVAVASSLVNMYSKCHKLELAKEIFEGMTSKDVVLWNCLMVAYVENGEGSASLDLFSSIDCEPDHITYATVLKACKSLALPSFGRVIHGIVCKLGLEEDETIATTLVDLYATCGCIHVAAEVFNSIRTPNIVSWTALLGGYSSLGDSDRVFDLAREIKESGLQLNSITFVSLLAACSHAGMVEDGERCFKAMARHNVTPTVKHYNCLVDTLSRASNLEKAITVVHKMPVMPNEITWTSLKFK